MKIKVAGYVFSIDNLYAYCEQFMKNYITDEPADCHISLTPEMLLKAKAKAKDKCNPSLQYTEFLEIYRHICNFVTERDGILMHGAVICFGGNAYMFTAPSGTGKTTHIKQWRKLYGDNVGIINGDKPLIRYDGKQYVAYGTPWCGKEHYNRNTYAPLKAIVMLSRSKENSIERVNASDYSGFLLKQIYIPKERDIIIKALDFADKMFSAIPVYSLKCNISTEAAQIACEAITKQ